MVCRCRHFVIVSVFQKPSLSVWVCDKQAKHLSRGCDVTEWSLHCFCLTRIYLPFEGTELVLNSLGSCCWLCVWTSDELCWYQLKELFDVSAFLFCMSLVSQSKATLWPTCQAQLGKSEWVTPRLISPEWMLIFIKSSRVCTLSVNPKSM